MYSSAILFLNLGTSEIVLIILVFLLFFGAKSVPSLARGLGKGMREFKDAANGIQEEIRNSTADIKHDLDKTAGGINREIAELSDLSASSKKESDTK